LLNYALRQTDGDLEPLTEDNWREIVRHRLQAVAWNQAISDVRPFLEPDVDPSLLTPLNLTRVLD
jgi:hypothetical protein